MTVPAGETLVVCAPKLSGQNEIKYFVSNAFICDVDFFGKVKATCITDIYGVFHIVNEFEQNNYTCITKGNL